jgi:hypothetical protein
MKDEKRNITAHFIAHWGVPKEIRPRKICGIQEFAILEFAPRGARRTWRYATNGMNTYLQSIGQHGVRVRTEVYACTGHETPWVHDLLSAIASYPMDYSTYLAEGDTISVGQPIDRNCSCFTGILLAPPGPLDPPTLGLVAGLAENVLVHQVVGLVPSELDYAERHNGKNLWNHLIGRGEALVDEVRATVV